MLAFLLSCDRCYVLHGLRMTRCNRVVSVISCLGFGYMACGTLQRTPDGTVDDNFSEFKREHLFFKREHLFFMIEQWIRLWYDN